jgi:AbrB family looped-hinge helix DNA binding protein
MVNLLATYWYIILYLYLNRKFKSKKALLLFMKIVSVTHKGQVKIPEEVRKALNIKKGTKLLVDNLGKEYVLMKKVEMIKSMKELQKIGQRIAKEQRLTPKGIQKEIEKIRAEIWNEKYAKRYGR